MQVQPGIDSVFLVSKGGQAMLDVQQIAINSDLDIVAARVEGRRLAQMMGFSFIDQVRIVTAISELARNVVLYANGGWITLKRMDSQGNAGIEILCEDQGPGIENLERVMQEEGLVGQDERTGLPGIRCLMDEFEIGSLLGRGTTVRACKWLH
jgi:serine/threonine-protein kinase RsbT